jgi:hypothetical protein
LHRRKISSISAAATPLAIDDDWTLRGVTAQDASGLLFIARSE